jgi:hypothetical protein
MSGFGLAYGGLVSFWLEGWAWPYLLVVLLLIDGRSMCVCEFVCGTVSFPCVVYLCLPKCLSYHSQYKMEKSLLGLDYYFLLPWQDPPAMDYEQHTVLQDHRATAFASLALSFLTIHHPVKALVNNASKRQAA